MDSLLIQWEWVFYILASLIISGAMFAAACLFHSKQRRAVTLVLLIGAAVSLIGGILSSILQVQFHMALEDISASGADDVFERYNKSIRFSTVLGMAGSITFAISLFTVAASSVAVSRNSFDDRVETDSTTL